MKLIRVFCCGVLLWSALGVCEASVAAEKRGAASDDGGDSKKAPPDADQTHVVKRGEKLWGIARRYEVSVGEMMDLNHMTNDQVHEGQVLRIPQRDMSVPGAPPPPVVHVVVKGETFRGIARKEGITEDELEHANPKVDPDSPKVGTKLKIPAHPAPDGDEVVQDRAPKKAKSTKYVVLEHDTYHSIAKARGITVEAIEKANPNIFSERLRPGMTLVLPAKTPPHPDDDIMPKTRETRDDDGARPDDAGERSPKPVKAKGPTHPYVISHGESAQSIAEAFGISVKRLCEINGMKPAAMKTGDEIQVPDAQ